MTDAAPGGDRGLCRACRRAGKTFHRPFMRAGFYAPQPSVQPRDFSCGRTFLYIRRTRHGANQGLGSDLCLSGQLRQYFRTYELSVRQRLEAGVYRPQRPRQDDLFEALDGGISLSGACRRADGLRLFSLCGAASRIPGRRGARGDRPRCAVLAARARDGSAWAG